MAKRKQTYAARLSANEIGSRINTLSTKYTQKELAARLGISVRTLNYYQSGHNLPGQKKTYEKINRLYNKERPMIDPGRIPIRREKQKKTSETQTELRRRWIVRDILDIIDEQEINGQKIYGIKDLDVLMYLIEKGYEAAYFGFKYSDTGEYIFFPREWTPGEDLPRFVSLIGICIGTSPKEIAKRSKKRRKPVTTPISDDDVFIMTKKLHIAGLPKINEIEWDEKMDIGRYRYIETTYEKPYTIAKFLGIIIPEE